MPRPDALPDPALLPPVPWRAGLPLQGLTVLAVEDSRYACEALRLICQRAGARLRRAETLAAARAHLRCYRPDVVIVDLGLPDGRGEDLIRALALARSAVVLGMSGDPDGRIPALAAGAAGFLAKPLTRLSEFVDLVASLAPRTLPVAANPPAGEAAEVPRPDPLALRDDLAQAAAILADDGGHDRAGYVAGFVRGLARASGDRPLEDAALAVRGQGPTPEVDRLAHLLADRLTDAGLPLAGSGPAPQP